MGVVGQKQARERHRSACPRRPIHPAHPRHVVGHLAREPNQRSGLKVNALQHSIQAGEFDGSFDNEMNLRKRSSLKQSFHGTVIRPSS